MNSFSIYVVIELPQGLTTIKLRSSPDVMLCIVGDFNIFKYDINW